VKAPELTQNEAEQLLLELDRRGPHLEPATQLALAVHDGVAYFSRAQPAPHEPESALVKLVQGVYDTKPESALHILRHRIFLNYEPGELCRGMLKVAARRLSAPLEARDHGLALRLEHRELGGLAEPSIRSQDEQLVDFPLSLWTESAPPRTDEDFLKLAMLLATTVERQAGAKLIALDRAIAALLVAPDGSLLSWGVNRITRNRTLHAELNAAQRFWRAQRRPLPPGTRVYSTLKACKMCAGMLWHLASDPRTLHVRYLEFDSGPNARETVFNQKGLAIEQQSC
jgi:hypothetical protein